MIDADSFVTVLQGAAGAIVIILGDRQFKRWRNGKTFTEEAETIPGYAKPCKLHDERSSRIEARIAALERTPQP